MAIWHVAPLRFAPAFRALGVCEHIWPYSVRDIWATLLSPKLAEMFVAQMAGDETSLPPREYETFRHEKFAETSRFFLPKRAVPASKSCQLFDRRFSNDKTE